MTNNMKINKCGCGGTATLHNFQKAWINCNKCGIATTPYHTFEEAIERWNEANPEQKEEHVLRGLPNNNSYSISCDLSKIDKSVENKLSCPQCMTAISVEFINNTEQPQYEPLQKKQYIDFLKSLLDTCNISQYAFDTLSIFDYPIFEEPTISNAMQAVKWLEEGKKIHTKNDSCYLQKRHGTTYFYEKSTKQIRMPDSGLVLGTFLQINSWQLYEEPKYKEITGTEALSEFVKNNDVIIELDNKQLTYNGYNVPCLLDNARLDKVENNPQITVDECYRQITKQDLERNDWRIYEID